jgi:hypothetical protein
MNNWCEKFMTSKQPDEFVENTVSVIKLLNPAVTMLSWTPHNPTAFWSKTSNPHIHPCALPW